MSNKPKKITQKEMLFDVFTLKTREYMRLRYAYRKVYKKKIHKDTTPHKYTLSQIEAAVCEVMEMTPQELKSESRHISKEMAAEIYVLLAMKSQYSIRMMREGLHYKSHKSVYHKQTAGSNDLNFMWFFQKLYENAENMLEGNEYITISEISHRIEIAIEKTLSNKKYKMCQYIIAKGLGIPATLNRLIGLKGNPVYMTEQRYYEYALEYGIDKLIDEAKANYSKYMTIFEEQYQHREGYAARLSARVS